MKREIGIRTAVFAVAVSLVLVAGASAIPVWINEIHYDNDGTDTNEFIEVAGKAEIDLSDYQIVLYNGSSSQRKVYDTITLSGIIADIEGGYGVASFGWPEDGIQNGGPDGIALWNSVSLSVLQFLSYEGSFTAVDGPAAGLTSIDIGVRETASTAIGESLQLTGTGSDYSDFTWNGPAIESPGTQNAGQTFTERVFDGGATLAMLLIAATGLVRVRRREAE